MENKLNTFDFNCSCAADREIESSYPSTEHYPIYGDYCFSEDAIAIIEKLQARIAELEAEKG